jgi:flagellar L-ring protein precursor FlgH
MSSVSDSLNQAMAQNNIATPVIIPEAARPAPGSLWQPGSRQFFKDSRAHRVGDMVTIVVNETAEATSEAATETTREYDGTSQVGNLANLEGILKKRHILDPVATAGNLLSGDSQREFTGEGETDRKDTITATISAIVTQVLPNGYLVVQGKREVVVNYELQELQIQGIVRPEDIGADNTVSSSQVAEARVFYAGRGIVDESQTPQYGVRFMDRVLPF